MILTSFSLDFSHFDSDDFERSGGSWKNTSDGSTNESLTTDNVGPFVATAAGAFGCVGIGGTAAASIPTCLP